MRRELAALSRAEKLVLSLGVLWLLVFVGRRVPHLFSPTWIEWDARAMALAAFRFHGRGLFPRDLGADLAAAMCPPGWQALYWLGTLVTDPYQVSRLLPFALFAFLLWQAFAFARARGGLLVGAATAFLVARCPFFWDRMVGANPRAFGLPLVVAFLRYATEGRARAAALVLVAQAACYPSVLLLCAPAFALLQLRAAWRARRLAPVGLLVATGLVCGALAMPTALSVDPRLGPPIRIEELAALRQRAVWSLFPLPPHRWVFERAVHISLEDEVGAAPLSERWDDVAGGVVITTCALLFVVALWRRRVPAPFVVLAACAAAAYALACAVAYRLYVPDRMVHYAAPPLLLLLFVPLANDALLLLPERHRPRRPALVAVVAVVGLTLLAGGLALSRYDGLHDWAGGRTRAIEYLSSTPEDTLVAAHPATASFVQVFAHRSALFSGITNAPNFVEYGRTVERRIAAFYDAYYAPSLETVRAFARQEGVDLIVVDERDFGNDARLRARYVTPWTEYAQARITLAAGRFALAAVPPEAIRFRDGKVIVVDAKKL